MQARRSWKEWHFAGVDADMRAVREVELPELHKERAAGGRSGRVPELGRIADVAACGKVSGFVLKDAVENQDFLAALVDVGGEAATGCEANDGRRAGDFVSQPVQHAALHPGTGDGDQGVRAA